MENLSALTLSFRAAAILAPKTSGRVIACFERACYLEGDAGKIVVLVWDGLGPGPLNVVLDRGPGQEIRPRAGDSFSVGNGRLLLDTQGEGVPPATVDLTRAALWDARPDWAALQGMRDAIIARAAALTSALPPLPSGTEKAFSACRSLAEELTHAGTGEMAGAINRLVGLGPGLTPMGDDWLAGWLLSRWLQPGSSPREAASRLVLAAAETRTNRISQAFLACAAAGEADHHWQALLDSLRRGNADHELAEALRPILVQGATSGLAMLLGFLSGLGSTEVRLPPDGPSEENPSSGRRIQR